MTDLLMVKSPVTKALLRNVLSSGNHISILWRQMDNETNQIIPSTTSTGFVVRAFTLARTSCVRLIKNIGLHFSIGDETRDLAVQLASLYLLQESSPNACIEIIAATSVITATKLLDSARLVSTKSFSQFEKSQMKIFECIFLRVIGCEKIVPLNTPSFFAWSFLSFASSLSQHQVSWETVSDLIGRFLEDNVSVSFAPSVIAMAAVLSLTHLDPADRISFICEFADIFPSPLSEQKSYCTYDVDKCSRLIERSCLLVSPIRPTSPPSVAMKSVSLKRSRSPEAVELSPNPDDRSGR